MGREEKKKEGIKERIKKGTKGRGEEKKSLVRTGKFPLAVP